METRAPNTGGFAPVRDGAGNILAGGEAGQLPEVATNPTRQSEPGSQTPVGTILVPTDFSPVSLLAVERAIALANPWEATLTLLHVIDINAQPRPGEPGTAADLMSWLWGDGTARMSRLARSLNGRVKARTLLGEGLPWEEIVETSRGFDMVVLGRSRARNRSGLFSRQTARRVVERAACPVMVVSDTN